MNTIKRIIAAGLFAAAAVSCIAVSQAPAKSAGGVMADSAGMTLYMFGKASGDWTIIARDDGSKQWAYKGKPVYKYSKDTKAGEMTGDGFNGVWHAVKG